MSQYTVFIVKDRCAVWSVAAKSILMKIFPLVKLELVTQIEVYHL